MKGKILKKRNVARKIKYNKELKRRKELEDMEFFMEMRLRSSNIIIDLEP